MAKTNAKIGDALINPAPSEEPGSCNLYGEEEELALLPTSNI